MPGINMRMTPQDQRFFSPDRDLAYCTPHLVHRALQGLDPGRLEPWVEHYLYEHGLDNDALIEGAAVIATYMNKTLLDPQYKQPFDALHAAGFFDLSEAVQTILLAKIGQVFMSGFFTAIRDVSRGPNDPAVDMDSFGSEAVKLQQKADWYRSAPWWRKYLYRLYLTLRAYWGP